MNSIPLFSLDENMFTAPMARVFVEQGEFVELFPISIFGGDVVILGHASFTLAGSW